MSTSQVYYKFIFPDHDTVQTSAITTLLSTHPNNVIAYDELAEKGEYSIKFLLLLAKLLMHQEKTNYPGAYMFRRLLEQLKTSPDIFSVVSTATFR